MADSGPPLDARARCVYDQKPSVCRGEKTLSRNQRITKSKVFQIAFKKGFPQVGNLMVLRLVYIEEARLRLGVIASKRTFRRAVDRNQAKRKMREAYRQNRMRFKKGVDVILVARGKLLQAEAKDIEHELIILAQRTGLLERD